jgi:RNA polymerase sigma-70 factor (ECF subfamily)
MTSATRGRGEEPVLTRALIDAARRGDEAAFAELFHALHPPVLRYLRAMEPRTADDLAGEVWMAVAQHLTRFEGDAMALRSWVFSIAHRRVADHRRRSIRRRTDVTEPSRLAELPGRHDEGLDPAERVGEALNGQEAADRIVALLPPEQAEVVLLRVLAGLDVEEVAELMGRSSNWVRVTAHRGLRRLADRISETGVMR